jgi:hypothetical protein
MILSSFFLTLWFYPCDFKTKGDFTPLCEVSLTVLTFGQRDNFAHVFLPRFVFYICVFTLFSYQSFGNFNTKLDILISSQYNNS